MSKYLRQVNVKLSPEMAAELMYASKYQGLKVSELVRGWMRDALTELSRDRRYQKWRESALTARKAGEEEIERVEEAE